MAVYTHATMPACCVWLVTRRQFILSGLRKILQRHVDRRKCYQVWPTTVVSVLHSALCTRRWGDGTRCVRVRLRQQGQV